MSTKIIEIIRKLSNTSVKSNTNDSGSRDEENPDDVIIQLPRKKSTTDVIRKSSDLRLLDDADMRLVEQMIAKKKGVEEISELDISKHTIIEEFIFNNIGLSSTEAEKLLEIYGKNELPETVIPKWYVFVSQLWQPMPLMIWIAALVEAAIKNWLDMGILLFIQFFNASIGYYEITKAGDAVAALKNSLQAKAIVKRDGKWQEINAIFVVPGDLVQLASGSAIPADARINNGTIDVDQAALTGESLPITMYTGDSCKMGSTVVRGEVEGTVEFTGSNTFFGKTASLLSDTGEVSNLQEVLITIVRVLVGISTILCGIVFGYLLSITNLYEALSFTVVLMVSSIPMAIELVTTTTLALGSKELSYHGAIVTRLAAIEDLAGMSILCSDKTGTLTLNKMQIQEQTPIYKQGENQYSLLRYAAMAAKWKEPPRDALDTLTLTAVDMNSLNLVEQESYMPFDPVVKRTEGTIRVIDSGVAFKTTKGAPHVLLNLLTNTPENDAIKAKCENDVHDLGLRGIRSLAVAKTNESTGEWELLGLLTFLDPPRPDTKQTIEDAKEYGVMMKMITGDHLLIARETSRLLALGDRVLSGEVLPLLDPITKQKPDNLSEIYGDMILATDGFAQVFPEHKYLIVECLREMGYKTGMTGDGVNDAPALKRADVGVAVHGATDAAKAAADIVLTQPGLSTIVHGIKIARCIFVRIRNFVTYRIAATIQLLLFFFIAVFALEPYNFMPANWESNPSFYEPWPVFFHMPVLMLMLITLLNDGTLIAIGYDNVTPSEKPEKWNLKIIFLVSTIMATVAFMSSLLILFLGLDSWNENGLFQTWGLGGLTYGQITTMIYLKISISDFLTLFSSRTGADWFWSTKPAPILIGAGSLALSISTILACSWPKSYPDGIETTGLALNTPKELALYIWLYCIIWWVIQDAFKVAAFYVIKKFNIFHFNENGQVQFPESTLQYIADNNELLTTEDESH